MKQQITKEQWDELDVLYKNKILNYFYGKEMVALEICKHFKMTTGQMIDFLGELDDKNIVWYKGIPIDVDLLWENVKNKLK